MTRLEESFGKSRITSKGADSESQYGYHLVASCPYISLCSLQGLVRRGL